MSRWDIGLSEKMKACKEAEPFTDILEGDGGVRELDFLEIRKQCYFLHFTNSLPNKNFPLVSLASECRAVSKNLFKCETFPQPE